VKRLFHALLSLLLVAAVLATVLTVPASADRQRVTYRLTDGSTHTVVLDLPPGATPEIVKKLLAKKGILGAEPIGIEYVTPAPPPTTPAPPPATTPLPPPATTPEPAPAPKELHEKKRDKPTKRKHRRKRAAHHHHKHKARPEPETPTPQKPPAPARPPTPRAPGFMDALPGPSHERGVPNFVIRKFRVPPFLLSIYQAAGIQYGVRWEVLAAINEIETDYGRNLNVSSAGAVGWMQFMPSTWRTYGVDANKDGRRDPYNPVDAIFAAARYLNAAGYSEDPRRAVFAYNHAGWYVDSVMLRAKLIAGVPGDLIGSLTGLTEGRFPVYARARYAESRRPFTDVFAREGSPVVAVQDGVVKAVGSSRSLGRYVVLQDAYGNRYTYSHLGSVQSFYPVPKEDATAAAGHARALPAHRDRRPRAPASAGRQAAASEREDAPRASAPVKQRLFAHPSLPMARESGGLEQVLDLKAKRGRYETFQNYFSRPIGLDARGMRLRRLRRGSRVISGTILGRIGRPEGDRSPHLRFGIRPAGRGAPRIDPKPILDGWKLLEATAVYRPSGRNALRGSAVSIGQLLLMPKTMLERRLLQDERVDIYPAGRDDIRSGQIDRRVLATIEYLAESGLDPTVTSLKSGHGFLTASGNVSEHSSGNAVDIAKINGIPILGHQEHGGITEQAVRQLMRLQGTMRPHQIISLLDLGANTMALADHYNHIHVGFQPLYGENRRLGREALAVLKPGQWSDLLARLRRIRNPVVPTEPSRFAVPAKRR
jgi:Transglycosylase SLT domain/Peptidase family M23